MTKRWNISPYPQVIDWDSPATQPGNSRDFDDVSGLSSDVWAEKAPAKNASNQSGGTWDANTDDSNKEAPKDEAPVKDTPAAEAPAAEGNE